MQNSQIGFRVVRCDKEVSTESNFDESLGVQFDGQLTNSPEVEMNSYTPDSPPIPGPGDKGVIDILWYNASSGSQTTWALASSIVDIYITLKGPFSSGDELLFELRENVISGLDVVWDQASYTFSSNLGQNDTLTLIWNDVSLDPSPTYGYGEGTLQVDKYFINAYRWEFTGLIWQWVQFHEGSHDEGRFLWMWGSIHFTHTQWLNSTGEWIFTAKKNWQVTPYHYFEIITGAVAEIDLFFRLRYDVVWWFDENVPGGTGSFTLSGVWLPGNYVVYWPSPFTIPSDRTFGRGFGDTRGMFDEVWKDALEIGLQLYHGGSAGYELFLVDDIPNQAPAVSIIYPADGQVIESSSASAYCTIDDPNSGYDVNQVTLYLNGVPTDITSNYSAINRDAEFTIIIPGGFSGFLNMTVEATDGKGLKGSDTVFLLVKLPTSVFPIGYETDELDISGSLLSYDFEWAEPLSWSPDENWNFTITPWVQFGFDFGSSVHILYGLPDSVDAGEEFTALFKVTDLFLTLNLTFQLGFDFYFRAEGNYTYGGSMLFLNEVYSGSIPIELGVDTFDLRYDIPQIAPFMQSLTHFAVRIFDIIPFPIDWLIDLEVSVDIVPILKLMNSLVCDLTGSNVQVALSQLSWFGNDMLAVNCTADSSLIGSDNIQLTLSNFVLQNRVGMSLGAELLLTGIVLGRSLPAINVNEWMYQHLGIVIPTLDVWLLPVNYPLLGSASLQVPVSDKIVKIDVTGISATETQIQVTIFLHDDAGSGITGAIVSGLIGSTPYTASELGSGQYRFTLPYSPSSFDFAISASKTGHIVTPSTITLFIDPMTVDESPPQITDTSHSPEAPEEGQLVTVTTIIIDSLTGVKNASLYYSVDSGPWTRVTMSHTGNMYSATIPAQIAEVEVRYYIETFDNAGHRRTSSEYSYTTEAASTTEPTTTEPPTTEPTTPQQPGIPGFPIAAITLGLVAALGIGIVSHRRRRKR
ncbi:MAG: hypothetical protein ACFFDP_10280 [Promethearchaeota archaeon]